MPDKVFMDSNIFVYAIDSTEPAKMDIARKLLTKYPPVISSVISFQVVKEVTNVYFKKVSRNQNFDIFRLFVEKELKSRWKVNPTFELYDKAVELKHQFKYSFYDSLILSAAIIGQCKILYSEDLQSSQKIEELVIVNPFV